MTTSIRYFSSVPLLLVTLILASACEPRRHLKESDGISMEKPKEAFATRCIGRYLVDVPNTMVLHQEGGQNIEEVQLDVVPMDRIGFGAAVARRKQELEGMFVNGPEKYPFLRKTTELPAPAEGVVFDRAENPNSGGRISRQLELLGWKNGFRISAKINAIDTSFPEDANEAALQALKPTLQANRTRLLDIFSRTSGRGEDIPSTKGVCILNGFVSGPATDVEDVTMLYQMKDAADVFFRFSIDSRYTRAETLLDRGKNIEPLIAENQGRVLRSAKRSVTAIDSGEEFLYAILGDATAAKGRIMTYKFAFEANSKVASAAAPSILVNFDNGESLSPVEGTNGAASAPASAAVSIIRTTLSESEAIALWDSVIPTIRPRPGAF